MINNEANRVRKISKVCQVHKILKFIGFILPHLQWGSLFDLWDKDNLPERPAVVEGVETFVSRT
jgi:hypothetical protein